MSPRAKGYSIAVRIEIAADVHEDGLELTAEKTQNALARAFPYARSGGINVVALDDAPPTPNTTGRPALPFEWNSPRTPPDRAVLEKYCEAAAYATGGTMKCVLCGYSAACNGVEARGLTNAGTYGVMFIYVCTDACRPIHAPHGVGARREFAARTDALEEVERRAGPLRTCDVCMKPGAVLLMKAGGGLLAERGTILMVHEDCETKAAENGATIYDPLGILKPQPPAFHAANWQDGSPVYIVAPGDTWSGLAHLYLGSPMRWRTLWECNTNQFPDPDTLRAGDAIVMPVEAVSAKKLLLAKGGRS